MTCGKCGAVISESSLFCDKCGATATPPASAGVVSTAGESVVAPPRATKNCPLCGEEILQTAIKCRFCGSDLTNPVGGQMFPRAGTNIALNAPTAPASASGVPSIIIQNVQAHQPAPAQTYIPHQIKNPGVALLLSFIFPGGGQFYNGQAGKGILVLLTFWIFGISYIWSLFDAYSSAQRINRVGF